MPLVLPCSYLCVSQQYFIKFLLASSDLTSSKFVIETNYPSKNFAVKSFLYMIIQGKLK